jgi:hypothetical protein
MDVTHATNDLIENLINNDQVIIEEAPQIEEDQVMQASNSENAAAAENLEMSQQQNSNQPSPA